MVQIHLGTPQQYIVEMFKEELEHIVQRTTWQRGSWTDSKYGDAITPQEYDDLWTEGLVLFLEDLAKKFEELRG